MKNQIKKSLITIFVLIATTASVGAESLFTLGAMQTYAPAPKSLYGGVQARSVGDLISIRMSENITMSDNQTFDSSRKSATVDNFSNFINNALGINAVNNALNNFGGSNKVSAAGQSNRQMAFGDIIAVQVVQQMPNGNLMVQGKKTLVSGNERMDLLVTGIVDPRWINALGEVYSRNVANLQFASSGRGSISRNDNEGIINKFIKYLF